MNRRDSYLSERIYSSDKCEKVNEAKSEYWTSMLGEAVCNNLKNKSINFTKYLFGNEYVVQNGTFIKYCFSEAKGYVSTDLLEYEIFFGEFYTRIVNTFIGELKKRINSFCEYYDSCIFEDFALHLEKQLHSVCLRTLIVKMNEYKRKGKLIGNSVEDEYLFFCNEIVGKEEFCREVFDEYPILFRCICEKGTFLVKYYEEIITNFKIDRGEITNCFNIQSGIRKITGIKGNFSDVHNGGRQVLFLQLSDNYQILYKPHSMKNEQMYMKLLQYISNRTGTEQMLYSVLSYDDHSWCSIVKGDTCEDKIQLQRYYVRLGEQLFLAYLLGTKDLHCENMIASGEFPVLIDLENLVDIQYNYKREKASEEVYYQVLQSVLFTGLLPFYLWNEKGEGISNSALGGKQKKKCPFKIPGVINPRTSEMQIKYYYPVIEDSQSMATLNGEYVSAHLYQNELIHGFTQAYECVRENCSEISGLLKQMFNMKSRYLLAETQRYSMILSSSYHPSLLIDGAEREIFLYSIWKGRQLKDYEFVKSEVSAMLKGDIPYFYYRLDSRDLYSENKVVIKDYFQRVPMELLLEKLENLNPNDLKKQSEYIKLSLSISTENKEACVNRVYSKRDVEVIKSFDRKRCNAGEMNSINKLLDHMINHAIWNETHTEVSWYIMQLASVNSMTWNIKPIGYYLYDGLAGILLLLEMLQKLRCNKEVVQLRDTVRTMLFDYTQQGCTSSGKLLSRKSGAYDGESSILYVYLTLYNRTRDKAYLEHAKMHAKIVQKLVENDMQYDLISGNAGAIQVLLELYKITSDDQYLNLIHQATEVLYHSVTKMETGVGWICDSNLPAMAGIAHGNAGIAMALLNSWMVLKEEKYLQLALKALEYEDYLYNEKINNWRDMRAGDVTDDTVNTVAWCHGAAGILLSRIQMYNCLNTVEPNELGICGQQILEKVTDDILRAYKKLKQYPYRDSFCLCHGTYGNVWILEDALNKCDLIQKGAEDEEMILEDMSIKLLPQERLNPGLMNGYGSVLYYLIKRQGYDVPDVLRLEV